MFVINSRVDTDDLPNIERVRDRKIACTAIELVSSTKSENLGITETTRILSVVASPTLPVLILNSPNA